MNYRLVTKNEEMCLEITIAVKTPARVRVKVYDEERPKTVLTDRYRNIKANDKFFVRMPMTPKAIIISVYDDAKGNMPKAQEANISIIDIQKVPLEKRIDLVDITNVSVANFVDLGQRFAFNANYLATGQTYRSDNGQFHIEYLPVIKHSSGRELTTPARISHQTGTIQVSQKYISKYTVPMVFMILCHEFSHYYVNDNIADESEADLNGLLIYLGLGYPRIEAYQAFLEVFKDAPSQQNKNRFDTIERFINNFEKDKRVLYFSGTENKKHH